MIERYLKTFSTLRSNILRSRWTAGWPMGSGLDTRQIR